MDRPRLRHDLATTRDPSDSRYVYLWDQLRLSDFQVRLTLLELDCLGLLDGTRTVQEVHGAVAQAGGPMMPLERFVSLVRRFDEALFLDGPKYRDRLASPIREPSCIGCYDGDPDRLRVQMSRLFTGPGGPGLPQQKKPDGKLRAALLPHIDYRRGGVSYGWGFKEVFERTDASLFVIIGTSHHTRHHRFILTRKNFKTPLGIVPTDQAYIDRLVAAYGDGLFDDEINHLPEHSIELEVVVLQYLYEGRRDIRIVPLLVGSFNDWVLGGVRPPGRSDIGRMTEALRRVEADTREPICYIISGDLAHIGPKFGDRRPVHPEQLHESRQQDHLLMRCAESADLPGYFKVIADEQDGRRICGFPPTYTVLEAAPPRHGKLLHYDQYVDPNGYESVSFASVAFYR
jgi:MEMO1 family protein